MLEIYEWDAIATRWDSLPPRMGVVLSATQQKRWRKFLSLPRHVRLVPFFSPSSTLCSAEVACHEGCAKSPGIQLRNKQSLASWGPDTMYDALIVRRSHRAICAQKATKKSPDCQSRGNTHSARPFFTFTSSSCSVQLLPCKFPHRPHDTSESLRPSEGHTFGSTSESSSRNCCRISSSLRFISSIVPKNRTFP